jgi:hypothetical protein
MTSINPFTMAASDRPPDGRPGKILAVDVHVPGAGSPRAEREARILC